MPPALTSRRPARDVALLSASSANNMLTLAVISLIVGNGFGIERFGVFAFVLAAYNMLALIGTSALQAGMLVFVPRHDDEPVVQRRYLGASLAIALLGGLAALALFVAGAGPAERIFDVDRLSSYLPKVGLALPLAILNKVLIGALLGAHRAPRAAAAEVLRIWALLAVVIAAAVAPSFELLFWGFLISDAANLLLLLALTHGLFGAGIPIAKPTRAVTREVVRYARHTFVGTVIGQINTSLDMFMVGYFLDERALGIYATAVLIFRAIVFVPLAFQRVYTPHLTRAVRARETAALERFTNSVPRLLGLVVGFLVVAIAGVYPEIVGVLFPDHPEYVASFEPFLYLAPGCVLLAEVYTVFPLATLAIDHPENVPRITAVSLVVNFSINLLAIPPLGLIGCALATSAAHLTVWALTKLYLGKHHGFRGAWLMEAAVVAAVIGLLAAAFHLRAVAPALAVLPALALLAAALAFARAAKSDLGALFASDDAPRTAE